MLKLKHLFENYVLAGRALEYWDYDKDDLAQMLSQFRISSNAIYPFNQGGKTCFLRLAPVDEKLEQNIIGELEFINYLLEKNFPALEPLRTKADEMWIKISTEWGAYYAAAFKRVAGMPVGDTPLSRDIMIEYGKTLGKLHSLSSEFTPTIKKWTHVEVLEWIGNALRKYGAKDTVLSELDSVKNCLDKLPIRQDNYGLVHYDFELDNVFYSEETETCAVIDFDDGMYHWYGLDIEQVFDSLREEMRGEALEEAKQAFMDGYRMEYCYTNEMEEARPLLRRFINLYSYARLIRCMAEIFPDEPEWMIDLRKKLEKVVTDLEAGFMEQQQ